MKLKRYISALIALNFILSFTIPNGIHASTDGVSSVSQLSDTDNISHLDSALEQLNLVAIDTVWDIDFNSHTLSGGTYGAICDSEGVVVKNAKGNYLEVKSSTGNSVYSMSKYEGDSSRDYGKSFKLDAAGVGENAQFNYFWSVVDSNYAVFSYDYCTEILSVDEYMGSVIFYDKSGNQVSGPQLRLGGNGNLWSGSNVIKTFNSETAKNWFNVTMITNLDSGMYYLFIDGELLDSQDLSSLNIAKTYKFSAYVRTYGAQTDVLWLDNYKVLEAKEVNSITETSDGEKYIDISFAQPIDTVNSNDITLSFGENKLGVASVEKLCDNSIRIHTMQDIFSAVDIDINIYDSVTGKIMKAVHSTSYKEFDMGNVEFETVGNTVNVRAKVYNSTSETKNVSMIVVLKNESGQIINTVCTPSTEFSADGSLEAVADTSGAVFIEVFFVDDYINYSPVKNIKFEKLLVADAQYSPKEISGDADFYFDHDNFVIYAGGDMGVSEGEPVVMFVIPDGSELPISAELFFADKAGIVSKAISLKDSFPEGKYHICIGSESGAKPLVGDVIVYDSESDSIKALINEINSAASPNALVDVITDEANKDKLVICSSDLEKEATQLCYYLKSNLESGKYTADSYIKTYQYALMATKLYSGIDPDEVLVKNSGLLNVDYETYSESELKTEIDILFTKLDWTSKLYTFDEISLIAGVRICDTVSSLWEYVIENADRLGLSSTDIRDFKKLSTKKQNYVFSEMIDGIPKVISVEEVAQMFGDAVYGQQAESTGSGSSGGSSGGFGGTSSKPAFSQNVVLPVETIQNNPQENTVETRFTDVDNHWAKDDIFSLTNKGIIKGYEDGTFRPDNFVTRAELAKLVDSVFGIPLSDVQAPFNDVNVSDWFSECVSSLYAVNIVNGSGGFYNPNEYITRQDAAAIISRALDYKGFANGNENVNFDDINAVSGYAKESVARLASLGIIRGNNNMFNPLNNLSRAEIATIINRISTLSGGVDN